MKQRIKHLILFIVLIAIDQASKFWAKAVLMNNEPIVIIPNVLNLQYLQNTGAVWGIMSGKVAFLRILTIIIILLIVSVYLKIPKDKKYTPLKLIMVFIVAGAIGNLIDRIYLSYVVDFIYFELINFPLFNIADSYVTVSSVVLFFTAIFYYKDEDFLFLDNLLKRKKQKNTEIENQANENKDIVNDDNEINNDVSEVIEIKDDEN